MEIDSFIKDKDNRLGQIIQIIGEFAKIKYVNGIETKHLKDIGEIQW